MSVGQAGRVVAEARQRSGWSQRALAEAAGTAQSVVGRIEAGLVSPSVDTLARLAHAAGFALKIELVPRVDVDPVIEAYKPGVDQTLLIENLRRSVDERLKINIEMLYFGVEADRARQARLKHVAEEPQ